MTATAAAPSLVRYRDEFPIFDHTTYLNSCSPGALSVCVRAATIQYLNDWDRRGASACYDTWLPAAERLRAGHGGVISAPALSISWHPSISSALTVVGESLDYSARRNVVTTSLDFPIVAYQWLAQHNRGIEVVVVEIPDQITTPIELLAGAIDERTALVATSHAFFTSDAIQDIGALLAIAHANGALFLADGYQAAGQVPVDVDAFGVDFYCAGGLKWLLGGSDIASLYVQPSLILRLEPAVTGWFAHAAPFRFDPRVFERASDGHRFDMCTPAVASLHAQLAGLTLFEETGLPAIRRVTHELSEDLIAPGGRGWIHCRRAPWSRPSVPVLLQSARGPSGIPGASRP